MLRRAPKRSDIADDGSPIKLDEEEAHNRLFFAVVIVYLYAMIRCQNER